MKIQLRFFASLREALGAQTVLELAEGASVGTARAALRAQGEPFASALAPGRALRAALNQTLCDEAAALQDGDELAFFPPVTGG
jgi:molybdopterin synthase sulfur carrier subunit